MKVVYRTGVQVGRSVPEARLGLDLPMPTRPPEDRFETALGVADGADYPLRYLQALRAVAHCGKVTIPEGAALSVRIPRTIGDDLTLVVDLPGMVRARAAATSEENAIDGLGSSSGQKLAFRLARP